MGLLSTGTSLSWQEIEQWAEFVKKHGIIQFINIFNDVRNRKNDLMKYGDEVEYCMIYFDHDNKSVRLDLRASEALEILQEGEQNQEINLESLWRMEYASYMIEGTPGKPFCCTINRLKLIETSMWIRKNELENVLSQIDPNLTFVNYATFPRVGCLNFTEPPIDLSQTENSVSQSVFFPDAAIFCDHPRFANLTTNIRNRIGHKQNIYVPVWFDTHTKSPFYEKLPPHADHEARESIKPDNIYMDCMGFGMGCSCLQLTIQAGDVDEARFLYDQLAVLAPIMMCLSGCSPAWKGILSDWDCRWKIISMACDDRQCHERNINSSDYIRKSRYDSIDMYLHPVNQKYNDVTINYSDVHYKMLIDSGVDDILARHISHLFCRDPISLFREKLHINDLEETDHFENIQSTNWQSCRFKPPPLQSVIGWRVEFRTLEVQFTCFENAAFVIFMVVLSRAIMRTHINLAIPISKMEENMDRAVLRDAVNRSKFFFNTNCKAENGRSNDYLTEISVNDIINGKSNLFVGLVSFIESYISELDIDKETLECISSAVNFIRNRANGTYITPASWMRKYILQHPKYRQDSLICDEILYDMTCKIKDISDGKIECPELFGNRIINKIEPSYIEAYRKMIRVESMTNTEKRREAARILNIVKSFEHCDDCFIFGC